MPCCPGPREEAGGKAEVVGAAEEEAAPAWLQVSSTLTHAKAVLGATADPDPGASSKVLL